jgi:hypothetical protein
MRPFSKFQDNAVPGTDVFITFTDKDGIQVTMPAILRPLGRDIYGASLDPDAEDVYEIAAGLQAECMTLPATVRVSGDYTHYKIWRNGPVDGGNEVFQDKDFEKPIAILADESMHICMEVPSQQLL